jgi:hypothetical protein
MTKVETRIALVSAAIFKTGLTSLFTRAAIYSAIFLALICIGSPLSAAAATPNPAGFDVLGMKLGMSVAQIEAAIRAYNPSFKMVLTNVPIVLYDQALGTSGVSESIQSLDARGQPPGSSAEAIDVVFTVTQPSRAFYISRQTRFEQQPLMDKTLQQFREKYGPESTSFNSSTGVGVFHDWFFDGTGKQLAPLQTCARNDNRAVHYVGQFRGAQYYSPACGITLVVQLTPATGSHLVLILSEHLAGDSIAVDDIHKSMAAAKAAKEQQRRRQEQNASGVRPAL